MTVETLAAALEREHREIDAGVDAFAAGLESGRKRVEALARALAALRRHIYLEEAFLFPPLRSTPLIAAVVVMIREHGQMWRLMDDLDELAASTADPEILLDHCRRLVEALQSHNFKEERIVYPQADHALSAEAERDLRAFLAAGTTPEGWICQGAAGGARQD